MKIKLNLDTDLINDTALGHALHVVAMAIDGLECNSIRCRECPNYLICDLLCELRTDLQIAKSDRERG